MRVAFIEEKVFENMIGIGERFIDIAEFEGLQPMDVALLAVIVDARLGILERLLRRGDRLQQPILHIDERECLGGGLLIAGDYRSNRIADIAHMVGRERILVLGDRQDTERIRKVLAGQHEMHTGMLHGARYIDRFDHCMRMGRSQQSAMQHARQHDIIGKSRETGDLGATIDATARLADDIEFSLRCRAHRRVPSSRITRAASSTASKICR
jgi:hypothetical protein